MTEVKILRPGDNAILCDRGWLLIICNVAGELKVCLKICLKAILVA